MSDIFNNFVDIVRILKADMNSCKPLETAAIIFLANLYLPWGIRSEYVIVVSFARAYSNCQEHG